MKYLRVDHSEVLGSSHLADLLWPDSRLNPIRLDLQAQFFAVPEDHPNISFILCLVSDPVWYQYPGAFADTEPQAVRIFA